MSCGSAWFFQPPGASQPTVFDGHERAPFAATADMFLQIRAGTDIAFLGGMIKYALDNDRVNREYLVNFTNAPFVIKQGFKLPEDGLFSGFDAANHVYDKSTWNYEEGGNVTGRAAAADFPGGRAPARME